MRNNKKMIVCFLTPALFMFLMVFLYPLCRTIAMSFFHVEGVSDAVNTWTFAGLENYITLINTPIFYDAMFNMLKIWLWGGIIVMFISMLFAAILTSGVRGKTFYIFRTLSMQLQCPQCGLPQSLTSVLVSCTLFSSCSTRILQKPIT